MTSLAKRERYAIAQTLRNLGPDAPTLCEGWTSFDLLVHLISRENRPDAAIGILIPAFSQYSKKVAEDIKQRGFENLVQEFEDGPKQFSPLIRNCYGSVLLSQEDYFYVKQKLALLPNQIKVYSQ